MKELKCTNYTTDYDDGKWFPCKCPVCGGFLKWELGKPPICNKCKSELIAIPDKELHGYGKICPISLGQKQKR